MTGDLDALIHRRGVNLDLDALVRRTGLEPLLTIEELAALSGESKRTIERRIEKKVIPVVRLSARADRIRCSDAAAYLGVGHPWGDLSPEPEEARRVH